jgi:oligosaccharide repeat unit polymerase
MVISLLGADPCLQNIAPSIPITNNTFFILTVSLYLFLIGAILVRLFLKSPRYTRKYYRTSKFDKEMSWLLIFIGIGTALFTFGFVFKSVPLLVADAENARVELKAGLGFLVTPAIFASQLGGLALFAYYSIKNNRLKTFLAFGISLVLATTLLGFGYRSHALSMLLLLFIIYSYNRYGRLPFIKTMVVSIIILVSIGVLGLVRRGQASLASDLVSVAKYGVQRVMLINPMIVERIMIQFPEQTDFLYGKSIWVDFRSLLPGADEGSGIFLKNMLGMHFSGGGVTPSFPGEIYLNFGWLGVVVFSILVGCFCQGIDHIFVKGEYHSAFDLAFTSLLIYRVATLSNGLIGGILFLNIFPLVTLWLLVKILFSVLPKKRIPVRMSGNFAPDNIKDELSETGGYDASVAH